MAKYFSWAILGRRKRFCENFSSFGQCFAKMVHFKNLKREEIKLCACKCNQSETKIFLRFRVILISSLSTDSFSVFEILKKNQDIKLPMSVCLSVCLSVCGQDYGRREHRTKNLITYSESSRQNDKTYESFF